MAEKVDCPLCGKSVSLTKAGKLWLHTRPPFFGDTDVPPEPCDASGTYPPGSVAPAPPLPGADSYAERMQAVVSEQSNGWDDFMGGGGREPDPEIPMTALGQEIAQRYKEIFYSYGNRRSSDNRGAQETLGPSEIGTPCDRRLAMSLLRRPAVNPGGDGWAAFVGTATHVSLADMFEWANAGTGRFATEVPLEFPSEVVPRGTSDLLDRVLVVAGDHKLMGAFSLKKLRTKGPSPTYRVQVHSYAAALRRKGEKVEHVAIIAWPRAGSSLDDMYVWTEPYDPTIVRDAFLRVDQMAEIIEIARRAGVTDVTIAETYSTADDCRYCPFYLKNSTSLEGGCNGKAN